MMAASSDRLSGEALVEDGARMPMRSAIRRIDSALGPSSSSSSSATSTIWRARALRASGALLGIVSTAYLVGALAWAFHVSLDRAVGYGLRTRDGFQRS